MEYKKQQYWHWMCSHLFASPGLFWAVLGKYKTPEEVFRIKEEELIKSFPSCKKQLAALSRSRMGWDFERESEKLKEKGIRFLSCEHPEYPKRLKGLPDRPGGLFLVGEIPGDSVLSVAVVGARTCSYYGKSLALWFSEGLAQNGVQVVSGMARGIDGWSHRGALKAGGKTFAVLGGGVDVCYPAENRDIYERLKEQGGILSESPPGIRPLRHLFPLRNRIISGLADAVLIIEAKEKSGSLITVDRALEQGRDVYAVPGRLGDAFSAGCHNLIRQGAGLAVSPGQLLEDLHFFPIKNQNERGKNKMDLERSENLVYSCLSLHPQNPDELCLKTGFPAADLLAVLTKLELKGYAEEVSKNFYVRTGIEPS